MTLDTTVLHFPKAGIFNAARFGVQPPREVMKGLYGRSTPLAVNVRTFDVDGRSRGGIRSGLTRHLRTPVVADWMQQGLKCLNISGESAVQTNESGRTPFMVIINQGDIYYARAGDTTYSAATNSTGDSPPMSYVGLVRSAPNNQLLFLVDGTNYAYFEPSTTSVKRWVASSGQLPADSDNNFCRLICTWRGRTTLSGLLLDDQNIFFSKVGEPTTWNYSPSVRSKSDAVALNLAPQGLIGDSVQTIIPYSDDVLIVGCANSLFLMAGDPADGGEVDRVSSILGTAWGEPWCMGPDGMVFFVGSRGGIWAMQPGQRPQRVSQGIEEYLRVLDMGTTGITMGYDPQDQVIYVFLSPLVEPKAAQHLMLDLRTMGWTLLKFRNPNHDPLAICQFDGNTPADRKLFLGSWDGFVRAFDRDARTDDGYPIDSEVILGGAPLLTQDLDEIKLHDMQAVLASESGDVTWEVLKGPTAEVALASEPAKTGTWTTNDARGGRNFTNRVKVAGHAIYIRVKSSVWWAMESVRCRISKLGPIRQRG